MRRGGFAGVFRHVLMAAVAAIGVVATAHVARGQPVQPRPIPAPERIYPGALDRPLATPESLRGDYIDPDEGVQIGLGPQSVALESKKLDISDTQRLSISDGVAITVDVALGAFRLGYVRQFYRRVLPAGTLYNGQSVNFLSVDSDQLWTGVGWRPWLPVYLAAGVGVQQRLIRLRQDSANRHTTTEIAASAGVLADLTLALPFSMQLRLIREEGGKLIRMESTVLEVVYTVPF